MGDRNLSARLRSVIAARGSVAELARAVGVSDNAIYKWAAGRGQPSVVNLVALAKVAGVSLEWLATGRESAGKRGSRGRSAPAAGDYFFASGRALAGAAGAAELGGVRTAECLALRSDWVRQRLGVEQGRLALVEALGDAMSPTIEDGDLLLVEVARKRPERDGVYLIRVAGKVVVRRLQNCPGGQILVKCDHPGYDAIKVAASKVRAVARLVWRAGRL